MPRAKSTPAAPATPTDALAEFGPATEKSAPPRTRAPRHVDPVIITHEQTSQGNDSSDYFDFPEDYEEIIIPGENVPSEAMIAAGKKEYADQLRFMEEKVLVVVHESQDENAEPTPMVSVNGKAQYFIRGVEQWVRRKYVEVLARARVDSINTGDMYTMRGKDVVQRNDRRRSIKYPFDIRADRNPRGRAWFQALMNEDKLGVR